MVQNACPHRGASLFFGRKTKKKDCAASTTAEVRRPAPARHAVRAAESNSRLSGEVLPVHRPQRVIWLHVPGLRGSIPPPELEGNMMADCQVTVPANNWMQASRVELHTIHAALHGGANQAQLRAGDVRLLRRARGTASSACAIPTTAPLTACTVTPRRPATTGASATHHLCYAMPPGASTWATTPAFWPTCRCSTTRWSGRSAARPRGRGAGLVRPRVRGQRHRLERFRIEQNAANDYKIDREAQSVWKSHTGIAGIRQQDMAMTESMGKVSWDRTREHLGNNGTR